MALTLKKLCTKSAQKVNRNVSPFLKGVFNGFSESQTDQVSTYQNITLLDIVIHPVYSNRYKNVKMRSSKTHLCTQVNFLYNLTSRLQGEAQPCPDSLGLPHTGRRDTPWHIFPPENNSRLKQKLTHLNLYTYPSREIRPDSCVCYYKVNDKYKGVLNGFYC